MNATAIKLQGALNGAIGDYLEKTNNGLAIEMVLIHNGKELKLSKAALQQIISTKSKKIAFFLHGSADCELSWLSEKEENVQIGTYFQENYDYTPIYLRYNSGKAIAQNAHEFEILIKQLLANYPNKINEIIFIGFSMGGLITKETIQIALKNDADWIKKVKKIFFIGSPHLGSPVERFAHYTSRVFDAIPLSYMKLAAKLINLRSQGIKDLRDGSEGNRIHYPTELDDKKIAHIDLYAVAGALLKDPDKIATQWLGDFLVPIKSATNFSPNNSIQFMFSRENISVVDQISHPGLTKSKRVLDILVNWMH